MPLSFINNAAFKVATFRANSIFASVLHGTQVLSIKTGIMRSEIIPAYTHITGGKPEYRIHNHLKGFAALAGTAPILVWHITTADDGQSSLNCFVCIIESGIPERFLTTNPRFSKYPIADSVRRYNVLIPWLYALSSISRYILWAIPFPRYFGVTAIERTRPLVPQISRPPVPMIFPLSSVTMKFSICSSQSSEGNWLVLNNSWIAFRSAMVAFRLFIVFVVFKKVCIIRESVRNNCPVLHSGFSPSSGFSPFFQSFDVFRCDQ